MQSSHSKIKTFNEDGLFCSQCLTHNAFFKNGGGCPECKGADCILYKNLTSVQKKTAREKFSKTWKEKWNL